MQSYTKTRRIKTGSLYFDGKHITELEKEFRARIIKLDSCKYFLTQLKETEAK